jgi:hypothetical protein
MSNRAADNGQVVAKMNGSTAVPVETSNGETALSAARPKGAKSAAEMEDRRDEAKQLAISRTEEKQWRARTEAPASSTIEQAKANLRRTRDGKWYCKREEGDWAYKKDGEVRTYLGTKGISILRNEETGLSTADYEMERMFQTNLVDFAQEIAGYVSPGEYHIGNNKVLVTKGAVLVELKEGSKDDFKDLYNFLQNAFKDVDQLNAFLGWLKQAVVTLRYSRPPNWKHGNALILIGESGKGKTSLQHLITAALAGRMADPKLSFKGQTSFNEQLCENEHWMLSDPGHKGTKEERDSFLGTMKACVANVWQGCHAKGKKEINLPTFRRLTISLNPDPTALAIIQGMESGTLEKTLILNFEDAGKYRPDGPGGLEYDAWEALMRSQLPYFLHWLVNSYSIPESVADPRYGVRYSNPIYTSQLAAPSLVDQELEVEEIIRAAVFYSDNGVKLEVSGLTSGDVYDRLRNKDNPSRDRINEFPCLRNSKATAGVIRKWLQGVENDVWMQKDGFSIKRRELRPTYYVYDFSSDLARQARNRGS